MTESRFWTKSSCSSLLLLTSAQPLTQLNFPSRPETIQVRVHHGPTVFPSPGVTWLPNSSGNNPVGIHSLSGWTPTLCVSHFIFIPPSDFKHPGPSWCHSILLVWQGRELLIWLSSRDPVVGIGRHWAGTCAGPRELTVPKQSPYHLFFNVLYNFGFQPLYMLGFHWLFTLFLRRSAMCSTCMQGEVGSAPTYLAAIFLTLILEVFFFYFQVFLGPDFKFTFSFLCHLYSAIKPIQLIFYFSVLKFLFGSFLYFILLFCDFFFSFISSVFSFTLVSLIAMAALQCLSEMSTLDRLGVGICWLLFTFIFKILLW